MKKTCIFLMFLLLNAASVFAGPIPEYLKSEGGATTPDVIPPPIYAKYPIVEVERPEPQAGSENDVSNASIKDPLNGIGILSSTAYYSIMGSLGLLPQQQQLHEAVEESQLLLGAGGYALYSSVLGSVNATNTTAQDAEPAVISIERNGTVHTTTSYIKIFGYYDYQIYYSSTTDFQTFTQGQLPLHSGYENSADPLMAENAASNGIAPKRLYITGLLLSDSGPEKAIAVWRSDNGGSSWSQPTIVATSTSQWTGVDKPAIGVSWHNSTLGYVYVAYSMIDRSRPDQSKIYVARSTNGGVSFNTPVLVSTGKVNGAQILVNLYYGHIYTLWTDFNLDAIRMSTSYNQGQSWSLPETAATGNMLVGDPNVPINGNIRVASFPMARFNWVANKISVVWTEYESSTSSETDVYFATKSNLYGWQAKKRINDVQTNDQFFPALDFDGSGYLTVNFYDRRDDASNIRYHEYSARINSNGYNIEPNERVSTFSTDPRDYTTRASFIGDYQDIWCQDFSGVEYLLPSWVGIPSGGYGDIYISVIQP